MPFEIRRLNKRIQIIEEKKEAHKSIRIQYNNPLIIGRQN